MAAPSTARVISKTMLRPQIAEAEFEMVDPPEIKYVSGQYIILHTVEKDGKVVKRSYSIASPPDPKRFRLCVKVVGTASAYVANLNPGDLVKFSGPWGMGKFTFPETTEDHIVFIAGGTGLSPIRSHLENLVPAHPGKTFRLLWGNRREEDVYQADALEKLAADNPHFSYKLFLEDPGPGWTGGRGRLSDHAAEEIGEPEGREFFLAGNGEMIARIVADLSARGVLPAKIHKEIFFLPPVI
ncbi:FAD-dependent oxidoreductase [bacterium]|nr:FAD-dependent oxidoreductase [bacterium]